MATRSQKVKLGVFLTAAMVLLIGVVVVLMGMGLFEENATYFVEFRQSVSGLEAGAPVKLSGVRVGTVSKIRVDPENVEIVEVRLRVAKNTPVKTDTKAFINMQGITGLKFVELNEGTAAAEVLPSGSEIQSGKSMFEQLTGRATDLGMKIEQLLNNILYMTREENQRRVDGILTTTAEATDNLNKVSQELTRTLTLTRQIAEENRSSLSTLLTNAGKTSAKANRILDDLHGLSGQVKTIMGRSKIPKTIAEFRQSNQMIQERLKSMSVGSTMGKVTAALDTLTTLLTNLSSMVSQNQDELRSTLYNFRLAAEGFKDLARSLNAKPSRLFFDNEPKQRELP